MKNTWTLLSVLYLLTSSLPENALAHPTPAADIEIPEIIPHPDLPSLKSLGLTSAGLYGLSSANHTAPTHQLQSRFQITCEDPDWPDGYAADNDRGDNGRANMLDAQACLNYLSKIGSAPCTVSFMYSAVIWCRAGTATVGGTHASGVTRTVISTCRDVAIGGQEIIDQCNWPRGVAGANAANGNGGLIVKIEKFNETLNPIGPIHH